MGFMALGDTGRIKTGCNMPTVDTEASLDVWAVLDEGCNSSVHGAGWAARAEAKLAGFGLGVLWINCKAKRYSGISTPIIATGKRAIPFCLSLDDGRDSGRSAVAYLQLAPGAARACQGHEGRHLHVEGLPGTKAATVQSTRQRAHRGQPLGVRQVRIRAALSRGVVAPHAELAADIAGPLRHDRHSLHGEDLLEERQRTMKARARRLWSAVPKMPKSSGPP